MAYHYLMNCCPFFVKRIMFLNVLVDCGKCNALFIGVCTYINIFFSDVLSMFYFHKFLQLFSERMLKVFNA